MEEKKVKELEIDFKDIDDMLNLKSENVVYKLKINGLEKKDVEWKDNIFWSNLAYTLEHIYIKKGFMFDLSETILPRDLKDISGIFGNCESLVKGPVFPEGVKNMAETFRGCENLIEAPVIPNSVINMNETFAGCTSLIKAPVLPEGVLYMRGAFSRCKKLKEILNIPQWVENMSGTFAGCTSLIEAPVLPQGVENMSWAFEECKSLVEAPVIPESVVDMWRTFYGCEKLNTAEKFQDTFKKISNTKIPVLDISKQIVLWMNDDEKKKLDNMFKKMDVLSEKDLEQVLFGWKEDFKKELKKDMKQEKKIKKDVRSR